MMIALRLAAAEPPVPADPSAAPDPGQLARGMQIEKHGAAAIVSRGPLRVQILRTPIFEFSLSPDANQIRFELDTCWAFGKREPDTFTLDMLEARLENAAALRRPLNKAEPSAVLGFRRALQLDPDYLDAACNLAAALCGSQQSAEAAAVLAPFVQRNLAKVYLEVLQRPALAPLLDQPSFAALRVQPRGTAALRTWDTDWAAYSPKYGWLAVLDPHDGLRIFVLKNGELVAAVDLGDRIPRGSGEGAGFGEQLQRAARRLEKTAQRVIAHKQPAINRFLADLGFAAPGPRESARPTGSPTAYEDLLFPRSQMKLVVDGENLQLWQAEHVIAAAGGLDGNALRKVTVFPALHTALWKWARGHGSTECGRQEGTEILIPAAPLSR